jgi:hypothetical protein
LFDQASTLVTVDSMAERMPCGPEVGPIVDAVREYRDAGFDRLFINQIGHDQKAFFDFFAADLAPALAEIGVTP